MVIVLAIVNNLLSFMTEELKVTILRKVCYIKASEEVLRLQNSSMFGIVMVLIYITHFFKKFYSRHLPI